MQTYLQQQLEHLKARRPLLDVFDIHCEGPLGQINGLRLGSLPSQPVSFSHFPHISI